MANKKLADIIAIVESKLGKNSTFVLGERSANNIEILPTGVLPLDIAIGAGGYPKGRIVEIFGPEASGKTTLALHAVASSQVDGGVTAFVDAEHALDPVYAETLGVDLNNTLICQPDCGEEALEAVEAFVRSGVPVVVVDSVAALTPRAEIDGDMGAPHMGLQARLMSQAMRKLTAVVADNNCLLIFINQTRQKIGVVFGSPETTPGGNALKFYASIRVSVRRIATLKMGSNGDPYGIRVRAKVIKNKISAPFGEAEFDLVWGEGVDPRYALIDSAIECALIKRSGSWFSYKEVKLGQGRHKVATYLDQNEDVYDTILLGVNEHYSLADDGDGIPE